MLLVLSIQSPSQFISSLLFYHLRKTEAVENGGGVGVEVGDVHEIPRRSKKVNAEVGEMVQ